MYVLVPKPVNESIAAKEKTIPGLVWETRKEGADLAVPASNYLVERGPAWVSTEFSLAELATVELFPDKGVVLGELRGLWIFA